MTYTDAQKAEAIGLGLAVGAIEASRRTGVPRRSISRWLRSPQAVPIRAQSQQDVAAKLWEAVVAGTDAVLAGLRDPKARLSDKAQALRVVAEQHALLTGGVTSRTENANLNAHAMTFDEQDQLRRWLDSVDALTDEDIAARLFPDALMRLGPGDTDGA